MRDDRLRIVVDADYAQAIGVATFCFAILEWNAVWACERISPGSIQTLTEKTAGVIARKLEELAPTLPDSPSKAQLIVCSSEFTRLVKRRNAIIHGRPGTDSSGGQRLFEDGVAHTVGSLEDDADAFAACSIGLNVFLNP